MQGPVTLGHEIAGDIEEVGENVKISKKVIEELCTLFKSMRRVSFMPYRKIKCLQKYLF